MTVIESRSAVDMPDSPLYLQHGGYPAGTDRILITTLLPNAGIVDPIELKVSPRQAGPNLSVDVAPGRCVVTGTDIPGQGNYLCRSLDLVNLPIDPAPGAGLQRIDTVIARVYDDSLIGGSKHGWAIETVSGTDVAPPAAPATLPPSSLALASITVSEALAAITPADIHDTRVSASVGGLPVGGMMPWGAPVYPAGYHLCDGGAVSRSIYASLFALYGTTWGAGDGSTTFNLPNLLDRFPIGAGGQVPLGRLAGSRQITNGNLPAHGHQLNDGGHSHGVSDPGHAHWLGQQIAIQNPGSSLGLVPGGSGQTTWSPLGTDGRGTGIWINSAGINSWISNTGGGQDYMPPASGVNWIIRII